MNRNRILFTVLFGTVLAGAWLPSRAQGVKGITSAPAPTRPDSVQDTGPLAFLATSTGGVVAGDGLWGKVVVAGNPLLWEPIAVTLACSNDRIDLVTQTNADGKFAITKVNLPKAYTQDDDVRNQMEQHYEGCVVKAHLAGYTSTADTITERNLRENPYLTDITLTPDEHASGTAISSTMSAASPEATKAFEKAYADWQHNDTDSARRSLEKAVQLDPKFAEALYLLGRLQMATDLKAATESLTKAQAADPQFVLPAEWLATLAVQQKNWQDADTWTTKALELDPAGTARLWYYRGLIDYRMGKTNQRAPMRLGFWRWIRSTAFRMQSSCWR